VNKNKKNNQLFILPPFEGLIKGISLLFGEVRRGFLCFH